jgi:Protein of unknown function (DUF2764)
VILDQYYYAVSSLPFLDIDIVPAITMEEFTNICKSSLMEKDFIIISRISLLEPKLMDSRISVIEKWISWEGTLRNEIAKLRAVSLDLEPSSYLFEVESNSAAPGIAVNAFKLNSPLEAEHNLDLARWTFLDELETGHYFDIEKLIVYSLRLQILERKNMFTKENGNENFQKIYENIKEAVREA